MMGGGRLSRGDRSGDRRQLGDVTVSRRGIVRRLWVYLGKQRFLMLLALALVVLSNSASLVGPKLSGLAIDAIGVGQGA